MNITLAREVMSTNVTIRFVGVWRNGGGGFETTVTSIPE
jgi:hypothetical protein